jgi:hypothetical protein
MTRANDAQSAMVRIRAIGSPVLFLIECVRLAFQPTRTIDGEECSERRVSLNAIISGTHHQWSLQTSCHHVYDLAENTGAIRLLSAE